MVSYPRAELATVCIGSLKLEGLMIENGTFGIAVPQICSLFQFDKNQASRAIKVFFPDYSPFSKYFCPLNRAPVNVLTLLDFEYLVHCLALKGNYFASNLISKLPANSTAYLKAIKTVKQKQKSVVTRQGYIYLLDSGTVLKLGYSANVKSRIKSLQRWDGELELLLAKKGTLYDEQSYHRYLKATGESFGDEWYPSYRKLEILNLLETSHSVLVVDN